MSSRLWYEDDSEDDSEDDFEDETAEGPKSNSHSCSQETSNWYDNDNVDVNVNVNADVGVDARIVKNTEKEVKNETEIYSDGLIGSKRRKEEDQHDTIATKSSPDDDTCDEIECEYTEDDELHEEIHKATSIAELLAYIQTHDDGDSMSMSMSSDLARRIRDFRFAQKKRRETFGNEKPWGILGLYDHLNSLRTDLEWAEDAAYRRTHNEPYVSWTDYNQERKRGVNRPFFTYGIMVVCTIMLLASIGENGWKVEPLSVNPMIGPSAETLLALGAKQTTLIVNDNEWFRIVSPMVLHAGIIHYVLNMLAVWFIGTAVELSHGALNCAIIFIIPAVGGNILSAIFLPQYISVGASGGIFGLIGACLADILINWNLLFMKTDEGDDEKANKRRVWLVMLWLVFDIVINSLIGLTPFIDNFTHLGGMVYGFFCGLSTMERLNVGFFGLRTGHCAKLKNNIVKFIGLILSVIFIMVTTALLAGSDDGNSPCQNCRYFSCLPTRWWHCDDCDFVKADAIREPADSIYYTSLDLTCPDGEIIVIDVDGDMILNQNAVRDVLPRHCRKSCDNVFGTANL